MSCQPICLAITWGISRQTGTGRDEHGAGQRDHLRVSEDAGDPLPVGLPGTNEIPIIDPTVDPASGVECVQCLHENVAVGAAMGYARMTGKPGVMKLHVTPGAAHGIGNLFKAFK